MANVNVLERGEVLDRRPALAVGLAWGVSVGLVLVVGFLGTSASVPPLPNGSGPPWTAGRGGVHPSPWLVTLLLLTAILAGALALVLGLRALRRGWEPKVGALAAAGTVAAVLLVLVPPVGSADVYSYAAYGQIKAAGLDPYLTPPDRAAELGVEGGRWAQPPWGHTTSIYGPAATQLQAAVARLAGPSIRGTIAALAALNAVAFLLTGLLLLAAAWSPAARRRVGLLWWANPLLLYELVAGAHLDTIAVCLAVAGLVLLRRSRLLGGVLGGLAVAVKAPMALVGAAMAWADRRSPRRLAALAAGAAVAAGAFYLTAGPHVLDQARRASRFVSPATPWRPLTNLLDAILPYGASRTIVATLAIGLALVVGLALHRLLSSRQADATSRPAGLPTRSPSVPSSPPGESTLPVGGPASAFSRSGHSGDPTALAGRAAFVASTAWVLTAPYVLPWYDAASWALIPLVPAGVVDLLLVVHTTALGLAFLPGRFMPLPGGLEALNFALHTVLSPAVLAGVIFVSLRRAFAVDRRRSDAIGSGVPAGADEPGVEGCSASSGA
jgi:hypothetical protein